MAAVLSLGLSGAASAAWTNGQAASIVLGAPDFTTAGGGAASASRFSNPSDVCTDPTTGKLFVVDYGNNRILRFSATEAVKAADAQAEAVLGQPDFASVLPNHGGLSAKSLSEPYSCVIDAVGRLFVTDSGNGRVLRYDTASTKASFADADGVLGRADFVDTAVGTSATQIGYDVIFGIALDASGALYVADAGNLRVLRFDNAAAKANGAAADGVLGAPDFDTMGAGGATANTLSGAVAGLTVDAAGNLYVGDRGNNRVLRFDAAASKPNGAAADGVLGAADLTTVGVAGTSASTFRNALGVEAAADGTLYVSDLTNNRVLIFNGAASKANGASADHVLGQADFTTRLLGGAGATTLRPAGLGVNRQAGYLMIADYSNSRVVGHYQASLIPAVDGTCGTVAATSFQPTAGLCSAGTLSAAGVVRGASAWTWGCDGSGSGTSTAPNACSADFGATGANSGAATSQVTGGTWVFAPSGTGAHETGGFIPATGHAKSPPELPAGYTFPHGLFDFVLTSGVAGSSATVTLTFPAALPAGTVWWKYGRTAGNPTPHWYQHPGAVIAGNTVTITLTDDAEGDDAYTTAGLISDPAGPGVPTATGGASGAVTSIPTLSEWGLILLSGLLGVLAFSRLGRARRLAP